MENDNEKKPEHEHESDSDVLTVEKVREKHPPKWACILHNDDYTTMEFVIEVLMKFFHKNIEESARIMLAVHTTGHGVAGIFTREIAETKAHQVVEYAKSKGHPLLCTAEPA